MRTALIALALVACTDDPDDTTTEIKVVNGACAGSCVTNEDCGDTYRCVDWVDALDGSLACQDGPSEPGPINFVDDYIGQCVSDENCSDRQHCSVGRPRRACVASCAAHDDCPSWRPWCVEGLCEICDPSNSFTCPGAGCFRKLAQDQRNVGQCLPSCQSDDECPGEFCVAP